MVANRLPGSLVLVRSILNKKRKLNIRAQKRKQNKKIISQFPHPVCEGRKIVKGEK